MQPPNSPLPQNCAPNQRGASPSPSLRCPICVPLFRKRVSRILHFTDLPFSNQPFGVCVVRTGTFLMVDGQSHTGCVTRRNHLIRLLKRHSHRLFTEDMAAVRCCGKPLSHGCCGAWVEITTRSRFSRSNIS